MTLYCAVLRNFLKTGEGKVLVNHKSYTSQNPKRWKITLMKSFPHVENFLEDKYRCMSYDLETVTMTRTV